MTGPLRYVKCMFNVPPSHGALYDQTAFTVAMAFLKTIAVRTSFIYEHCLIALQTCIWLDTGLKVGFSVKMCLKELNNSVRIDSPTAR